MRIGTKGRDIVVWAFYMLSGIGILTPWAIYILIPAGLAMVVIAYFFLIERPKAIRYRQVALLPIHPFIARLLLRKRSLQGKWDAAYEVHIMVSDTVSLKEIRNNIVSDIQDIIKTRPGLYYWETHVAIPMPIKRFVKKLENEGAGFLREGVLFPRPPFVYTKRRYNKPLHHGAAIVKEG